MNDSEAVSFVERIGDLDGNREELLTRQRAALETIAERFAFEIFHHQEIGVVLTANVMQNADIGVLQP